jgi:hypothetical protein
MAKRDDPAKLAAIARFIEEIAGSKAEAHRLSNLFKTAEVKGTPGRPRKYLEHDAQVLFEVEMRENWYRHASAKERKRYRVAKVPKRHTLIKEAVSRKLEDKKLADKEPLGKSEHAATQRIKSNSSLIEMLSKAKPGQGQRGEFWSELAQHLPPDAQEQVRKVDDPRKFGAILELLLPLFAFARRHPRRFKRVQQRVQQQVAAEAAKNAAGQPIAAEVVERPDALPEK